MNKQFSMSMYGTAEQMYKAKAEYYQDMYEEQTKYVKGIREFVSTALKISEDKWAKVDDVIKAIDSKKFKAIVATAKTSNGNEYFCRLVHPDTPDNASMMSDWYFDINMSRYKGRMEYEAACLNRFFNLPESADEYIDILDFDGDNIDRV